MLLIPVGTDRPRLRPAYATIALIAINVVVHICSYGAASIPAPAELGGEGTARGLDAVALTWGLWGNHPDLVHLITHQFVHGSFLHLAGNMLFLWVFGSLMEDVLRPWGITLLYLGGGLCAALAHIGMAHVLGHDMNLPMVGASGAVAAIMGLFMLRFYKTRVQIYYWFMWFLRGSFWVRSVWALAIWVGLELLDGIVSAGVKHGGGVAHWAHVGGFAAGAAFAPFVGSLSGAKKEYFTDDPETNVEYLRRHEQVSTAEKALAADPGNAYLMRRLAQHYRHAGEYERATEVYQRCVYRFATRNMQDQATDVYLELMEYNETASIPPDLRLQVAKTLEAKHLPWAIWSYQYLTVNHVTRPEAEYALLRLAALYMNTTGQPDEALRCLQDFFLRYPNSEWQGEAKQAYAALTGEVTQQYAPEMFQLGS